MSFILNRNKVSTSNSTTSPLSGGATYTGTWEEIFGYSTVTVIVTTSAVAGTLYVDFSSDGTNTDRTAQLSSGTSTDISGIHSLTVVSKYFRIRLVNGASAQSELRIQTILSPSAKIAMPTSRLGQNIGQYSDVLNVRASNDVNLDTSRGVIGGRSGTDVQSRNTNVSTTEVLISRTNTTWTGFLTSATTVRIRSGGNANDTAAGSGAREITVQGLNASFESISETIATNGTSASTSTSASFIRIHKCFVSSAGTYSDGVSGSNAGDILIETTGGVLMDAIGATFGRSQSAVYTIPAGKTGYLVSFESSVESTKSATVRLYKRENADDTSSPFSGKQLLQVFSGLAGTAEHRHSVYIALPAKTDVWVTAQKDSAGTTAAQAALEIILIDN